MKWARETRRSRQKNWNNNSIVLLFNFLVYDTQEKIKLSMPSRKQKVKVSQELLNELEAQDVKFKLN